MDKHSLKSKMEAIKEIEGIAGELVSQIVSFCEYEQKSVQIQRSAYQIAISAAAISTQEAIKAFICVSRLGGEK